MNNQSPELFAQRPVRSDFSWQSPPPRFSLRSLLLILFLIILGCAFVLYAVFSSGDGPSEVPTISAEGPLKQRPEEPGGIEIPHQDVTVFERIDNSAVPEGKNVEKLLPPPEVPQSLPESALQPATKAPEPAIVQTPQAPQQPSPIATTVQPVEEKPVTAAPAKEENQQSVVVSIPKELFLTKPTKGSYIQLASLPDEKVAQAEMKRLQTKYKTALGAVRLRIVRVALGEKGTFYRIQSDAMDDSKARSLCSTMQEHKASCIVVHP